jgi:hypothetical protein
MKNNDLKITINVGSVIFLQCLNHRCEHNIYNEQDEKAYCNLKSVCLDIQGKCCQSRLKDEFQCEVKEEFPCLE